VFRVGDGWNRDHLERRKKSESSCGNHVDVCAAFGAVFQQSVRVLKLELFLYRHSVTPGDSGPTLRRAATRERAGRTRGAQPFCGRHSPPGRLAARNEEPLGLRDFRCLEVPLMMATGFARLGSSVTRRVSLASPVTCGRAVLLGVPCVRAPRAFVSRSGHDIEAECAGGAVNTENRDKGAENRTTAANDVSVRFPRDISADYDSIPTYPVRPNFKDFENSLRSDSQVSPLFRLAESRETTPEVTVRSAAKCSRHRFPTI